MKKPHFKAPSSKPQASGYSEAGASLTRRALKAFLPNSGSPNEDINRNNMTLRQRARLLYMSSPVATSAINTNRTKVVGTGLTLKATIDRDVLGLTPEAAKEWQRRTEAEFRMWANKRENCDALGMNNFTAIQQLVLKSWLLSGDVFVLLKRFAPEPMNPYSLRLHVVEADRVSTPAEYGGGLSASGFIEGKIPEGKPGAGHTIYDGVEVDDRGQVVAYHVCNGYPSEFLLEKPKWDRVLYKGAKTGLPNILPIMACERPDQYRGVSHLAQIIEPLLQLRRYTESELMAALIQSFFTAWIETTTDPMQIPFNEVGAGDIDGVPAGTEGEENISRSENEHEMGPGTVLHLEPGEKVQFGNPNIPTAGFDSFVKSLCRQMGAALELPYDVLVKEFNSSYSASRGALLEAWEAIKMRRAWFIDDLCQPVYQIWLAEAVALGRIKAPGFFDDPLLREAWSGARWIGPVQGSLDPLKEAKADLLLIGSGIKTHEQVTIERGGGDWDENMEILAHETELLRAAGLGPANISVNEPDGDGGNGEGDGEGDGE